jgi:hypothetical protein
MASLTVELVMQNGRVDQDGSLSAFEAALSKFVAQRETETSTLATAVGAILAKHSDRGIAMPVLAALALNSINVQPENYSALEGLLLDYVRENASDKREDGKSFRIGKGKGGGVRAWANIPVDTK